MKTYKLGLVTLSLIMAVGLFVLVVPTAFAQLKIVSAFYAWDYAQSKYQNSNVTIYADGGWEPFLHQILGPGTSNNEFDSTVIVSPTYGFNTLWAGLMDYSVNITDTDGIGQGFQNTRRWSLVFCDRVKEQNNNPTPPGGDLGNNDLAKSPPDEYYGVPYFIEALPTVFQNRVENCTNGTCNQLLNTRLIVNLDKDGNGQIDSNFLVNGQQAAICFYAEAKRPYVSNWGGNLQARISAGGGDKTVNFKMQPSGATAVTLSSFDANATDNAIIPVAGAITGALGLIGVLVMATLWKFARPA